MTAEQTVASSYEAWQTKHGDLSEVPLADDFQFSGPVASVNRGRPPLPSSREERAATTS